MVQLYKQTLLRYHNAPMGAGKLLGNEGDDEKGEKCWTRW